MTKVKKEEKVPATYKFKTIKEVVATLKLEQVDDFCADLRTWLHLQKGDYSVDKTVEATVEMLRAFAKLTGEDPDKAVTNTGSEEFVWTDDGERGVKGIGVQVIDKTKKKTARKTKVKS